MGLEPATARLPVAYIEKRRRICGQEIEGEEDRSGGGLISGTTCRRELSGENAQDRVKWRRLIRHIDPT